MEVAPFPNRRTNAGRYCSSPGLAREVNKIVNAGKLQTSGVRTLSLSSAAEFTSFPPSLALLEFVIPSEARNLLFVGSFDSVSKQQVHQGLKPFRNDKIV
jgi:hypothetical protein